MRSHSFKLAILWYITKIFHFFCPFTSQRIKEGTRISFTRGYATFWRQQFELARTGNDWDNSCIKMTKLYQKIGYTALRNWIDVYSKRWTALKRKFFANNRMNEHGMQHTRSSETQNKIFKAGKHQEYGGQYTLENSKKITKKPVELKKDLLNCFTCARPKANAGIRTFPPPETHLWTWNINYCNHCQ